MCALLLFLAFSAATLVLVSLFFEVHDRGAARNRPLAGGYRPLRARDRSRPDGAAAPRRRATLELLAHRCRAFELARDHCIRGLYVALPATAFRQRQRAADEAFAAHLSADGEIA